MAIEIVSFPINSMVDLSIAMLVYQRVSLLKNLDQWWMDTKKIYTPIDLHDLVGMFMDVL